MNTKQPETLMCAEWNGSRADWQCDCSNASRFCPNSAYDSMKHTIDIDHHGSISSRDIIQGLCDICVNCHHAMKDHRDSRKLRSSTYDINTATAYGLPNVTQDQYEFITSAELYKSI